MSDHSRPPPLVVGAIAPVLAAAAVGIAVALAGGAWVDEQVAREQAAYAADVEERGEAARTALDAVADAKTAAEGTAAAMLDARRSLARARGEARALALGHQIRDHLEVHGDPASVAALTLDPGAGIIDLALDRVVAFNGALGATVSVALPELSAALASAPGDATVVAQVGPGAWVAGPAIGSGLRPLIQLDRIAAAEAHHNLDPVAGALTQLAEPPPPPPTVRRWQRQRSLLASLGAVIVGLLLLCWLWLRVLRPLDAVRAAADQFVHGDPTSRGDETTRGPAFAMAVSLNRVADEAMRIRGTREAEARSAAVTLAGAIESMGKGDLGAPSPEVPETLRPIADAYEAAREGLGARVLDVHRAAVAVAERTAEVAHGSRTLGRATGDQVEALRRLAAEIDDAVAGVERSSVNLDEALQGLSDVSRQNRRGAQQMKASLAIAGRRAGDLFNAAEQLGRQEEGASAIAEALDLLERVGRFQVMDEGEVQVIKARAVACVRRGRQAHELLKREVLGLRDELEDVAQSLEQMKKDVLEPRAELDGTVTGTLHDVALGLVDVAHRVADGVGSLERAVQRMHAGIESVEVGAEAARAAAPELDAALAGIELGDVPDRELIERLEQVRTELAEAASADTLTPGARAIVQAVEEAADASRGRLARLIDATEATAETLRNA